MAAPLDVAQAAVAAWSVNSLTWISRILLCPSDAWRPSPVDSDGFGGTDDGLIYFVDLDPVTGLQNKSLRAEGALVKGGSRFADITDGTFNTAIFSEDIGGDQQLQANHVYLDPLDNQKRCFWRWAEADNAFGISTKINKNLSQSQERVLN